MMKLQRARYIILLAVCILDVTTLPAGAGTAVMTAHVTLLDYTGSNLLLPVGVQFIQNGVVVRTERAFLDPLNKFTISDLDAGTFDVAFSVSGCLRKVIPGIQFTSGLKVPIDVALANGDLNGDNSVGLSDLSIVSTNHGQQGQ